MNRVLITGSIKIVRRLRGSALATSVGSTKESAYQKYVAGKNLTHDQLIPVMAEHIELLQRPIVVRGSKAELARQLRKPNPCDKEF